MLLHRRAGDTNELADLSWAIILKLSRLWHRDHLGYGELLRLLRVGLASPAVKDLVVVEGTAAGQVAT